MAAVPTQKQVNVAKTETKKKLNLAAHPFPTVCKGYHKALRTTAAQLWAKGELRGGVPILHMCTYANCSKVEDGKTKFKHCPLCYTKYCSKECHQADSRKLPNGEKGQHRIKCAEFKKEGEFYAKCAICKNNWWREDFLSCGSCLFRDR
jgi:hypothetical protein